MRVRPWVLAENGLRTQEGLTDEHLDRDPAAGGTALSGSPKVTPPIGRDLTPEQELACAFRILANGGFSEDIAGHITWTATTAR